MNRHGEMGHLYHDSGISSELTALDAKERLRTREINAREERMLMDQTKVFDYAKRLTEKRHRYLSKQIQNELHDIKTRTLSLEKTKTTTAPRLQGFTSNDGDPLSKPVPIQKRFSLPPIDGSSDSDSTHKRQRKSRRKRDHDVTGQSFTLPKIDNNSNVKFVTKHLQTRVLAIHRTLQALEKARKKKVDDVSSISTRSKEGAYAQGKRQRPAIASYNNADTRYEKTFSTNRQHALNIS